MAKMFYTLEETGYLLKKTAEEIKQLAREGLLREFRDGPRLMFKSDQVERILNEQSTVTVSDDDSLIELTRDPITLPVEEDDVMLGDTPVMELFNKPKRELGNGKHTYRPAQSGEFVNGKEAAILATELRQHIGEINSLTKRLARLGCDVDITREHRSKKFVVKVTLEV